MNSDASLRTQSAKRSGTGRITLESISTIMGVLGFLFLTGVIAVSAWHERETMFREAEEHAQDSSLFLADHAQRLFEVADIALRSTVTTARPLAWAEIEGSRDLWNSLREIDALMPYVGDLWLNDQSGRLRMTTFAFPAPASNVADRPIFAAVSKGDRLVVGDRIVGKLTNQATFMVGRPLLGTEGDFRGMVSATLDLSYFTDYWRRLDLPNHERIAVVQAETGDVLIATDTRGFDQAVDNTKALQAAAAAKPEAGSFSPGRSGFGYYHRVGTLPLFVTVTFDRAGVDRYWEGWMARLAPLALAAMIALASIMVFGRRQGRLEARIAQEIAAAREALQSANSRLEERVAERTADLRETNDEIQRYAHIISHDLRAPLVNIAGFTAELLALRPALLAGLAGGAEDENARDFDEAIGFIRSSADKMDRLINAILVFSREGRRDHRPEPIDLTVMLRSIADGVAHRAQKAGAVVRIEPLPMLRSDRTAVEGIFSNLVDNAIKYLRPSIPGQILISAHRTGDRTVVTIADNGRGISETDRERIFELFRRAGPQDQPGEGIGLAHVRATVRRLGGRIDVTSRLNEGSVFTVDLPDLSTEAYK